MSQHRKYERRKIVKINSYSENIKLSEYSEGLDWIQNRKVFRKVINSLKPVSKLILTHAGTKAKS
jgi:hypothetical protein